MKGCTRNFKRLPEGGGGKWGLQKGAGGGAASLYTLSTFSVPNLAN